MMAGIQVTSYKGGAPAVPTSRAHHYYFASMPVDRRWRSGRARVGVTSKRATRRDRPPSRSRGCRYEATLWQGFFAPATIDPALAPASPATSKIVLKQPETREKMERPAWCSRTIRRFIKFFHADIEKWRNLEANSPQAGDP
jgi:tripartite-type tricarboxylate transporter receptor subunit TctC